jgi:hypothetical protein
LSKPRVTSPFHKGNTYADTWLDKSFDKLDHTLLHSAITVPAFRDKTMDERWGSIQSAFGLGLIRHDQHLCNVRS